MRHGTVSAGLLLLAPGAAAREDLSCEGYIHDGIDWGNLRRRFEIYADKYLDRPQLLAEEFEMAKNYAFSYSPENSCILGDLSLRFFLWLSVAPAELAESVEGSKGMLAEIMEETWKWFWDLPQTWQDILESGWPLFSILAAVAERFRVPNSSCETSLLEPFVETFDNAIAVSTHQCAAVLLEASLVACPEATASALVVLADNLRTTVWQQPNRYYHFTSTLPERQPKEDDVDALLMRAEGLLRGQRGTNAWRLLTSPWPFWRLLDRLGAKEVVNVTSDSSWFWMYVFPHRVRSDGLISNRIRGTSQAYCLQLFQDEVRRLAQRTRRLRLVEAGPHIGDCMLWAAAEFGSRLSASCVEPVAQVVSLFRRSIAANGFQGIIDLHHAFLGKEDVDKGGVSIPWKRIDSLLKDEDVDVLKIHTNGGERQILDGASELFEKNQVRVVILHSAEAHQLWPSAEFLLQRDYHVRVDGRRISAKDADWLRQRVEEVGGLQLHATREPT